MSKVYYVLARAEDYRYFTGLDFTETLTSISYISRQSVMKFDSVAKVLKYLAETTNENAPYVEQIVKVIETPVQVTFEETILT